MKSANVKHPRHDHNSIVIIHRLSLTIENLKHQTIKKKKYHTSRQLLFVSGRFSSLDVKLNRACLVC